MDPRAFLALAQSLAKGPGAAEYRTAVNRSYYAAYNFAVIVLEGISLTIPRTAEGHGEVRDLLMNSPAKDLRAAGKKLGDLYGLRERADYVMPDPAIGTQTQADVAIRIALGVIDTLERVESATPEQRQALSQVLEN
jgi:hypothetical protein